MKIVVLGAGAWGTALAVNAARTVGRAGPRHQVTLWARDAALINALQTERVNTRFLPGIGLPDSLLLQGGGEASLPQAIGGQDLIILATPVSAARSLLQTLTERVGRITVLEAKEHIENEARYQRSNGYESLTVKLVPR